MCHGFFLLKKDSKTKFLKGFFDKKSFFETKTARKVVSPPEGCGQLFSTKKIRTDGQPLRPSTFAPMVSNSFLSRFLKQVRANLLAFLRHPLALAVGLTFAADSFMFGTWVTQIPYVKTRLSLSDGELGLALFGMPLGLLLMNPVSPWLMQRFGLVRTMVWSTAAMAFAFVLPMWMPDRWGLFAVLLVIGVSVALMNVAMNTAATQIEETEGRHIMSSCHGMWSFGGMVGSALSAWMISRGVSPQWHLTLQATLLALATVVWLGPALRHLPRPSAPTEGGSKFALPNRDLLIMIFIGLCTSMCEGIAFDWSAVYLRDVLRAPEQIAALAFTCFSLTMMAMRFTGDVLIPRFGERNLLYFTTLTSFGALVVIMSASQAWLGLVGFLVLGMGVALAAPILFNAAARVPGFTQGAGLATYATFSFIGFLVGPPVIGLLGEEFGLAASFGLPAVLTLGATLGVRVMNYLR
jgi:MFS family permease